MRDSRCNKTSIGWQDLWSTRMNSWLVVYHKGRESILCSWRSHCWGSGMPQQQQSQGLHPPGWTLLFYGWLWAGEGLASQSSSHDPVGSPTYPSTANPQIKYVNNGLSGCSERAKWREKGREKEPTGSDGRDLPQREIFFYPLEKKKSLN